MISWIAGSINRGHVRPVHHDARQWIEYIDSTKGNLLCFVYNRDNNSIEVVRATHELLLRIGVKERAMEAAVSSGMLTVTRIIGCKPTMKIETHAYQQDRELLLYPEEKVPLLYVELQSKYLD